MGILSSLVAITKHPLVAGVIVLALLVTVTGAGLLTIYGTNLGSTDIDYSVVVQTLYSGSKKLCDITGHVELNQEHIATGWKPDSGDVKSEAISIDLATLTFDDSDGEAGWFTIWSVGAEYWYEWYDGDNLLTEAEYGNGNPIINPSPVHTAQEIIDEDDGVVTFNLITEPDIYLTGQPSGILTCVLKSNLIVVFMDPFWTQFITAAAVFPGITHGFFNAEMEAGQGSVMCGGSLPDVIEVGTPVRFELKTGFSHDSGWTCYIYPPPNTGLNRHEFLEDGFTGQDNFGPAVVSWIIPDNWFTPGGDNQCRITLANSLFTGEMTTFFVVDDIELIPEPEPGNPTGVIESVDGQAITGTTMTVHLSAVPNPISNSPIDYFVVWVYYGYPGAMPGTDFMSEFILYNTYVTANPSGEASRSFTITQNKPGHITIKANAVDEAGRASLGDFWSMVAALPGEEPELPDPEPPEYPFMWSTAMSIALASLILIIIAVIFIAWKLRILTNPKFAKWIIIILLIISGIFAYAIYWLGTNPGAFT